MKSRSPRYLAVSLAFAVLLAAAGDCHGEDPAGRSEVSDVSRVPDNVAAQDDGAAGPAVLLPGAAYPSGSPDNAVAQDNDAEVSPPPLLGAAGVQAPAAGAAGELEDVREPDFGGEFSPAPSVADPIEPVNRGIFFVNDKLYRWVFKPVAKGYKYVVPEDVRVAVRNFFFNLGTPIRAANTLLQGKFKATGTELARFTINTTIGMAGLFDAAKDWNLQRRDGDTGQTLGVWGLGNGFYLVLPVLGPSSARDAAGLVGDAFLDPLSYLPTAEGSIGARAVRSETDLTFRINEYEELTGAAVDPYIAVRDAYIQYREKRVKE